jgi:hypothetical protein
MEEKKMSCCFCTIVLGVLIIVFAWWKLSWAPIALTILGVLVIVKGVVNKCCCQDSKACKTKEEDKGIGSPS